MPDLNDMSAHQLVIQWRMDQCNLELQESRQLRNGDSWEARLTEGRIEEIKSCVAELEVVLGLKL